MTTGRTVDSGLLRTALSSDHPGRDIGDHRHRRCLRTTSWVSVGDPDRERRAVGGGVSGQLPLQCHRHQLPDAHAATLTAPELLVARCRGAVLRGLPDAVPSGGERRRDCPSGLGWPSAWCVIVVASLSYSDRRHCHQPDHERLLLALHPGLGARPRAPWSRSRPRGS